MLAASTSRPTQRSRPIANPPCGADNRYDETSRSADLILASVYYPVLDPEAFIRTVASSDDMGGALGRGPWSTRAFRARISRAHGLRGTARVAAFKLVERDLLRAAPVVPYGYWDGTMGYFSPNVGCRIVPRGVAVVDLTALCKK